MSAPAPPRVGVKIAAILRDHKKKPPGSYATVADALKAEGKFAAARQGLPTLEATGAALKLELQGTTAATDAALETLMQASRECACSLALSLAAETPEQALMVHASYKAPLLTEMAHAFVTKRLRDECEHACEAHDAMQQALLGRQAGMDRSGPAVSFPPGYFVRGQFVHACHWRMCLQDEGSLEKATNALEQTHRFRVDARVCMIPPRKSMEYERLAPRLSSKGGDLVPCKVLSRLDKGRFILLVNKTDGAPMALAVTRGLIAGGLFHVKPPPVTPADAAHRIRSKQAKGTPAQKVARALVLHQDFVKRTRNMLRCVSAFIGASGATIDDPCLASCFDELADRADGRGDGVVGNGPPTRGVVPVEDDGDFGAEMLDAETRGNFAKLNGLADMMQNLVPHFSRLRAHSNIGTCHASDMGTATVPASGGSRSETVEPVDDPQALELPSGAGVSRPNRSFAGREDDGLGPLLWRALDFNWARDAAVAPDAPAPIGENETLVSYWVRTSKPWAERLGQKWVSNNSGSADDADAILRAVLEAPPPPRAPAGPGSVAPPRNKRVRGAYGSTPNGSSRARPTTMAARAEVSANPKTKKGGRQQTATPSKRASMVALPGPN